MLVRHQTCFQIIIIIFELLFVNFLSFFNHCLPTNFPLNSILFSRNILPKSTNNDASSIGAPQQLLQSSSSSSPILNNYMISAASKSAGAAASSGSDATMPTKNNNWPSQQQQSMTDLLNGAADLRSQIGRQGPIKDVKSIIDDYRQKHPETVPRRGRRLKGTFNSAAASYLINYTFFCSFRW